MNLWCLHILILPLHLHSVAAFQPVIRRINPIIIIIGCSLRWCRLRGKVLVKTCLIYCVNLELLTVYIVVGNIILLVPDAVSRWHYLIFILIILSARAHMLTSSFWWYISITMKNIWLQLLCTLYGSRPIRMLGLRRWMRFGIVESFSKLPVELLLFHLYLNFLVCKVGYVRNLLLVHQIKLFLRLFNHVMILLELHGYLHILQLIIQ